MSCQFLCPCYKRVNMDSSDDTETTVITLTRALRQTRPTRSGSENVYSSFSAAGKSKDKGERYNTDINCDEVYPNIFIGDGATARNKAFLKHIGITHVLNTAQGNTAGMVDTYKSFYNDMPIKYLGFNLMDLPFVDISRHFSEAADFIEDGVVKKGKVYVHCLMGMSRSGSYVIAYLMLKKGLAAAEAIRIIRQKRAIFPNEGFLEQIADLDNQLRRDRESRLRRYVNDKCQLFTKSK